MNQYTNHIDHPQDFFLPGSIHQCGTKPTRFSEIFSIIFRSLYQTRSEPKQADDDFAIATRNSYDGISFIPTDVGAL